MIIDSIQNGIVIDHISAGKAMELYRILGQDAVWIFTLNWGWTSWTAPWPS